jgi:FMN phosphatase YigB (HAD superfamily)
LDQDLGDAMSALHNLVFLLDVDNTLLDNDRIVADLRLHLEREFGPANAGRYWTIFEKLRSELGYADYLGALQRNRVESDLRPGDDSRLLQMSSFLIDYPFAARLYPHSLEVVRHLDGFGTTVILSDGDVVFQPRKIQRSGLWDAVCGRVLIHIHKEQMLGKVQQLFPAQHYFMVDDKLRLLAAMKDNMRERLTTIFPCQGHYALDPANVAAYPAPDLSIPTIGALLHVDPRLLLADRAHVRSPEEKS